MCSVEVHTRRMIRFRRWSRKRYAVFCSIGRMVTIGHLCKGIVDASMAKHLPMARMREVWKEEARGEAANAEDDTGGGGDGTFFLMDVMPVVLDADSSVFHGFFALLVRNICTDTQTGLCLLRVFCF